MPEPTKIKKPVKSIAIACQGGGSHTAFTAGVLQTLLRQLDASRYRIHGLSGTSGGALCAAIAWYGLLQNDPERGARLLDAFWQDMATTQLHDALTNQYLVWLQRNRSYFGLPEVSPYQLPTTGQDILADTLRKHIDFSHLPALVKPASPILMVGAVEVLSGCFTVFDSTSRQPDLGISIQALLASAAIPELFRAVQIGKGVYWDGLFSQNPPIRGFLSGKGCKEDKPDEIWVIQINPETRATEPKSASDIDDRRNELAGNISMNQELFFVHQTNDWIRKKWLNADHLKHVDIRHIPLELELDYPSKLDRRPAFIEMLLNEGRRKGTEFLAKLPKA
jgi:NTE family protein